MSFEEVAGGVGDVGRFFVIRETGKIMRFGHACERREGREGERALRRMVRRGKTRRTGPDEQRGDVSSSSEENVCF